MDASFCANPEHFRNFSKCSTIFPKDIYFFISLKLIHLILNIIIQYNDLAQWRQSTGTTC